MYFCMIKLTLYVVSRLHISRYNRIYTKKGPLIVHSRQQSQFLDYYSAVNNTTKQYYG